MAKLAAISLSWRKLSKAPSKATHDSNRADAFPEQPESSEQASTCCARPEAMGVEVGGVVVGTSDTAVNTPLSSPGAATDLRLQQKTYFLK